MVTNSKNKWWSRSITLVIWALASASAAWWGLRLTGSSRPVMIPLSNAPPVEALVDSNAVAKLLGAVADVAAVASLSSRFALLGVVAGRSNQGAALISVDGKPGRPYRVGSKIEEGLILQAVEPRRAKLAPASGNSLIIEMPPLKK